MRILAGIALIILVYLMPQESKAACTSPDGDAGEVMYQAPDLFACNDTVWYSLTVNNTGTACTKEGEIRYQAGDLRFCNATNWISIDGSSLAASCTAAQTGKFQWNPAYWQMQWCNGTVWKLIGPPGPHALVLDGTGGSTLDGNPITTCGGGSACNSTNPFVLSVSMSFSSITMQNGAYLTGVAYSSGTVNVNNGKLGFDVSGNVDICANCVITMTGKGYGPAGGSGAGSSCGANCAASGSAHGGYGGGSTGAPYGDIKNPTTIGSGGGDGGLGGNGGRGDGLISFTVGGTLLLNGTISSLGNNGVSGGFNSSTGGGSGGSINITAATLSGSGGVITADGGGSHNSSAGAGSGGRIALRYTTDSYTGGISALSFSNKGGATGTADQAAAGTTYLFHTGVDTNGRLIVNNGTNSSTSVYVRFTPILTSTDFDSIATPSNGIVSVPSGVTVNLGSDTMDFYLVDSGMVTFPTNSPVIASGGHYDLNVARTFASVLIQSGGILGHWKNTTAQTNVLNITTTGNFTIASGGKIDVGERGYANSSGPGQGGDCGSNCVAGGAGHGGYGGDAGGAPYGDIKNPATIGSGGGNGGGGSGTWGGGLVTLNVGGTLDISGLIDAVGGNGFDGGFNSSTGGGAGGGVNITTATLTGTGGTITANGGTGFSSAGAGSGGRIAIRYTTDSYTGGISALTISNRGGTASGNALASAGTTYLFQTGVDTNGRLIVNNGSNSSTSNYSKLTSILSSTDFDSISTATNGIVYVPPGVTVNLASDTINFYLVDSGTVNFPTNSPVIANGGRYEANVAKTFASVLVQSGGVLGHWRNSTAQTNALNITTTGNFTISSGGALNINSKGYANSSGPGAGGDCGANCAAGGGAHGGYGGISTGGGGSPYGSIKNPATMGSGGGNGGGGSGSWGGGLATLNVGGTLDLSGTITALGGNGFDGGFNSSTGGGGGGGINITTVTLAGSGGSINADGGAGFGGSAGAGSGGRIALRYTTDSYTGGIAALTISNKGSVATGNAIASAGTTYLMQTGVDTNGRLIVNNGTNSSNSNYMKDTPILSSADFDSISTATNGIVLVPSGVTVNLASDTIDFFIVNNGTLNFPTNSPIIASGGKYYENVARTFASVTIQSGGSIGHWRNAGTQTNVLNLTTTGNFTINSGGSINVSGRGYAGGSGTGPGTGGGVNANGGGGAHGGNGGTGSVAGGTAYGSATNPITMGSGGGNVTTAPGGWGGGLITLNVSGILDISGSIVAGGGAGSAGSGDGGAGAGGGINITTNDLAGTGGTVSANGANGAGGAGGGGGGRIHIGYVTDSYTGGIASLTKTVTGGTGGTGGQVGSLDIVDLP